MKNVYELSTFDCSQGVHTFYSGYAWIEYFYLIIWPIGSVYFQIPVAFSSCNVTLSRWFWSLLANLWPILQSILVSNNYPTLSVQVLKGTCIYGEIWSKNLIWRNWSNLWISSIHFLWGQIIQLSYLLPTCFNNFRIQLPNLHFSTTKCEAVFIPILLLLLLALMIFDQTIKILFIYCIGRFFLNIYCILIQNSVTLSFSKSENSNLYWIICKLIFCGNFSKIFQLLF